MTVQCCVCKKVKSDRAWKRTDLERPSEVSHTYCPVCLEHSKQTMATERLRADRACLVASR